MEQVITIFLNTWFLWLPLVLGVVFREKWLEWRRAKHLVERKWTLLEISIPKDIHKSPEAMEIVFNTFNEWSGLTTWWKRNIDGAVPHYFSVEIASIEGTIYFFIRTPTKFKEVLKSQIYSQFPHAEIHESDDYTRYVGDYTKKQDTWELFGVEFGLIIDEVYPIKTYVDYGLDKAVGTLEEEQKIDPMAPMLEFFGSLRKGEQIWMQMVIRSDKWHPWRHKAIEEINRIMGRDRDKEASTLRLTHGEQEKIKAIERSLTKPAFDVGFRMIYLAPKESFRGSNIAGIFGSVRQFQSPHLNGFKPEYKTDYDYFHQDPTGKRLLRAKRIMFDNYINRAYFQGYSLDYFEKAKKTFILTSEELATIFRFPGRVSETSAIERVEATKVQPPANLPI